VLRREPDGGLWFVDPLLPVWIALERERQASPRPLMTLSDPRARAQVLQLYQERLHALQQAMGPLFEKRVHNVVRQFRGQTVSAKLFGASGETLVLPTVRDVRRLDLPDPDGRFSGRAGSVEIDGVTDGTETWLIECKHGRGGVAGADVDRLLRKRKYFEQMTGRRADRLWIVSNSGLRSEARERCEATGIYYSGAREVARLERALAHRPQPDGASGSVPLRSQIPHDTRHEFIIREGPT
jgi:hypothetical protein